MSETIEKPAPKRLSYTEALNMAQLCHRDGLWEQAEQLYRTLRKLEPGDANAMHFFGVLRHQQGHSGEAPELIRESIGIDPNKLVAAEAAFKGALERNATFADAHTNLGSLYGVKSRHDEALHHLFEAIRPEPEDLRPRRSLGRVYVKRGDKKKAAEVFRDCVLRDPDSVEARDFLAAVTGENVPERAPDVYVSELFDTFASSFDAKLAFLDQKNLLRDGVGFQKRTMWDLLVDCITEGSNQYGPRSNTFRSPEILNSALKNNGEDDFIKRKLPVLSNYIRARNTKLAYYETRNRMNDQFIALQIAINNLPKGSVTFAQCPGKQAGPADGRAVWK